MVCGFLSLLFRVCLCSVQIENYLSICVHVQCKAIVMSRQLAIGKKMKASFSPSERYPHGAQLRENNKYGQFYRFKTNGRWTHFIHTFVLGSAQIWTMGEHHKVYVWLQVIFHFDDIFQCNAMAYTNGRNCSTWAMLANRTKWTQTLSLGFKRTKRMSRTQ